MLNINKVHIGCGNFGGVGSSPDLLGCGEDQKGAFRLLARAKQIGISVFDTANSYGGGESERILGEWVMAQEDGYRSRIEINTKVGNPIGVSAERGLSRDQIYKQIAASLKRLRTNYVDTYYFHEPDRETDLLESLSAMHELIRKGHIRSVGLSNVDAEDLEEALEVIRKHRLHPLSRIQNSYSYLDRKDEARLIPLAQANGIQYIAYSPLAGGILTGKYQLNVQPKLGSRLDLRPEPYQDLLSEESFNKVCGFVERAKEQGITPQEYALRFIFEQGCDGVVIGPRKEGHFESLGII